MSIVSALTSSAVMTSLISPFVSFLAHEFTSRATSTALVNKKKIYIYILATYQKQSFVTSIEIRFEKSKTLKP
ncbi:hypothetical protein Hanom_Chr05g00435541 [Helianthus anomalus]